MGEGSPSVCVEGIIVLGSDVRVSPVLSGFRWVGWLRFFLILLGVSLAGGAVWLFTVEGAKITGNGVTVPENRFDFESKFFLQCFQHLGCFITAVFVHQL